MTDSEPSQTPTGPLAGVRMLEFSQIIAGPVAGVYLSDLGVNVVKVEPPRGDDRRNTMAVVPNEGKYFQSLNRGKRGLVVDLQRPEGRALIHRIIPTFDVVTINYRPGVAERLEIDYETLSAIRPDLIYVNITGFGRGGPESARAGSDIVAQAYSGLMATEGKTEESGAPRFIQSAPMQNAPRRWWRRWGVVGAVSPGADGRGAGTRGVLVADGAGSAVAACDAGAGTPRDAA